MTSTAPAAPQRRGLAERRSAAARAVVLGGGLAAAMTLRLRLGGDDAGASRGAGVVFALALGGLALAAGWSPHRVGTGALARALGLGAAAAALLCALPLVHRLAAGHGAVPMPAWGWLAGWSAATLAVAVAEEVLLRGALYAAVHEAAGQVAAIGAGAVAFALLHLPMYGTGALPLDLGVGVLLGCLRAVSGGVTAPATAHAGADLLLWWVW